ncbi:lmo0937 family membrane protein [Aureimonas leprariae]|uniref:Lmo0937 family membrane protein n=1 Tax=Plantimonas leprariae TaxID=2615207 RepID=A0A7V7PMH5_9HYPH|nr:lmo0937 family membrane protein [Aureimonas leprariae]KAB0678103.1 lmo0937 family membrane protein [Aureimonas leprariae]
MLWAIAIVLVIAWILGGFVFHVAGGLIHILLVIAVVVVIYQVITGQRRV